MLRRTVPRLRCPSKFNYGAVAWQAESIVTLMNVDRQYMHAYRLRSPNAADIVDISVKDSWAEHSGTLEGQAFTPPCLFAVGSILSQGRTPRNRRRKEEGETQAL